MALFGALRSQTGGANKKRSTEPIEWDIDPAFETALDYYADHDQIVSKCADLVANDVWRNAWRVKWGETLSMSYFEQDRVRAVFRRQMIALRNRLRIKKYVGMWYYRDMRAWMRDFRAAYNYTEGASAASTLLLPFGPVEPRMGCFALAAPRGEQTLDRQIVFYPDNEDVARYYGFAVFDDGAKFWPVSITSRAQEGSTAVQREAPELSHFSNMIRELNGAGMWSGGAAGVGQLRPVSSFTTLYELSRVIKEAQDYTMSAALNSAFPMAYATANAIPTDPLDDITDDNLAMAKSLNEARTQGPRENAKFSLQRAQDILSTLKRALSSAAGGATVADPVSAASLAEMTKEVNAAYASLAARYGRVNPATLIRAIPDFVTITQGREPKVNLDMEALNLTYEIAVCREMDWPHAMYRTEVSTARTSGAPNLDITETIRGDTVRNEQTLYKRMFDWIYMVVFGALDREAALAIVDEVHTLRDDDNDEEKSAAQRAIQYMARMVQGRESYARLEFELLTVRSTESLRALVEFQQMGIVSRELVHRNAANLFGHTLGADERRFEIKVDGRLHSNLNAPLLPPVEPDTKAKLTADATRDKEKAKGDMEREKLKIKAAAASKESSGEPPKKKQKTNK